MRIKLLLLSFLLSFSLSSQISDISELASGELIKFTSIKESDGTIYGYFIVSKLGDVDKTHSKYEYVILDKNLNKVANGEFNEKDYRGVSTRFGAIKKVKNKILITVTHFSPSPIEYYSVYNTFRTINLEDNKVSEPFYFNDEKVLVNGERPNKKFLRTIRKNRVVYPVATESGFLLNDFLVSYVGFKLPQTMRMYDIDRNKKWEHTANKEELKGIKINEIIDDNNIIYSFTNTKNRKITIYSLDPQTGEEIFKYELENENSKANHMFNMEDLGDRYVIVGKMSPFHRKGYDSEKAIGVFRIELDKKGNELSKKYFFWNQASDFIEIDKKGKTKDGFRLIAKNFYVFKNGSISILTEKRKPNKGLFGTTSYRTADFVILNFDKDFNLKSLDKIEKDLSKYSFSDYLYSQQVKNGNGVVFFYNDHKEMEGDSKKKNWVLGIVSIIDGKLNHEQIPMSSEDHFIIPYVAKEGYILLRELNKDSDYDQLRLEKLNY
ncbi:hypothetical protein ACOSP6_10345 [Tenacibaculum sp. MEBiC06402]|uniref:hypothetical protein n=1 Tax=unclassified Tenacibaculum TaxID=2635139 RepID=UPI003B9A6B7D